MGFRVNRLALEGVVEIIPDRFGDERGFFSETYNMNGLREHNIDTEFVQDNHSWSRKSDILRGLHFQAEPCGQEKLFRVLKGKTFNVVVDIRRSSSAFGRWLGIELSADKWNQLLVPSGFASGFLTLAPDCEVAYKVSKFYSSAHDSSIRFDDPQIAIDWPLAKNAPILSEKDETAPMLKDAKNLPL